MLYENTFSIILIIGVFKFELTKTNFNCKKFSVESAEQNIELLLTFTKMVFGICTLSSCSLLGGMLL